ncbi:isopenicillin N synthase family dioxygenase [Roseovarius sp.]|uniref:isopenicillin N synthase family dioxygenase n=1 Tax=Roseovarius sp. TaxID=1486281 RepID=UPI003BAD651B
MTSIPIIHLNDVQSDDPAIRREVVETVRRSCTEIGFLYVDGHGVAPEIIARMRGAVVEVFDQPAPVKAAHRITPGDYRGYIPLGFFTPASGDAAPDQYEGFKLHLDVAADDPLREDCDLYGPNLWPEGLEGAKAAVAEYWAALDRVADRLLRVFGLALGREEGFFLPFFRQPLTGMTLLHYPAMDGASGGFGIHPHKDSSAFTILYPDPVGGLLVQTRGGDWIEAEAPEGAFIVNIGDVLEHWSGGVFKSTPHKVINRSGRERYSFPYFATPRFDAVIEPAGARSEGYDRQAIRMERWHRAIIAGNWPDSAPIDADIDPRIV